MMNRSISVLGLLLATAACQAAEDQSELAVAPTNMSSEASDSSLAPATDLAAGSGRGTGGAGPDIRPAAAPGVAFDYRYAFRLEADRVAEAQQEHQRLCERYTVSRCRITGMVYRAASEDDVEAMLAFRVDPAIAAQFGREGVQAVLDAEGDLTESTITGTDAAPTIESVRRDLPRLEAELERIQARLSGGNLGREERSRLESEAQLLRQQLRDLRNSRETAERSLATTPMLFRYGSGTLAPGFTRTPTIAEALDEAGKDFKSSLNLLLVMLVRLLPWAALGLIVWAAIRFARRRFQPKLRATESGASA
jgi:hypothetical protein